MRRCLKPNHGTEAASLHVVVDTETTPYPDKHGGGSCTHLLSTGLARRWRMEGGRQTRQAEVVFSDRNVFWNWLFAGLDARRPCWVWAHNAGFDLTALRLWEAIESGELRLQDGGKGPAKGGSGGGKGKPWSGCCVTEDPPTIICCRHSQIGRAHV